LRPEDDPYYSGLTEYGKSLEVNKKIHGEVEFVAACDKLGIRNIEN